MTSFFTEYDYYSDPNTGIGNIYKGMLEEAEQWKQLLKNVEDKQLPNSEKKRLVEEYFQLEEGESVIFPGQEAHQHKVRPIAKRRSKDLK